MIELSDKFLMMIEPQKQLTEEVNDNLTEIAQEVLASAKRGRSFRGFHTCICGVLSDSAEHILPSGRITNSLLVHYVRDHREEVPQKELDKLVEEHNASS